MIPSRENIFRVLARMEQSFGLPESSPVSVFICEQTHGLQLHPTQIVLKINGDTVFVRFTRLPFVRPYVYSRQALKVADVK